MLNLTPHEIVVKTATGERRFPPSGKVARVKSMAVQRPDHDGIPVVRNVYGAVEGMPETSDVPVLVSVLVLTALNDPNTGRMLPYLVLCPDTGPDSVVRDESGKIVGVKRLMA